MHKNYAKVNLATEETPIALLTGAQMKRHEQAVMQSGAVTGLALMERAGKGVVAQVLRAWPELRQGCHSAVVLCGPGNNGGDGFVVARLLYRRGWRVSVVLLGEVDKLRGDAAANAASWRESGKIVPWDTASASLLDGADLVVDALFGTGLTRAMPDAVTNLLEHSAPRRMVAVDIPSGLCADSGRALGFVPRADLTVSFHARKLGHILATGPDFCGQVAVVDIGLPELAGDEVVHEVQVDPAVAEKGSGGHKFSHGSAVIASGGVGASGAARLSARAALRVGAGLVTLAVPTDAVPEVAAQITAVMMQETDTRQDFARLLEDDRIKSVCLGPGLGLQRARQLVPEALRAKHKPALVLDADALTAFRDAPEALFARLHDRVILTPHMGEFGRLFPDLADLYAAEPESGPARSKVGIVRRAAERAGCAVLLKGRDTVIAMPGGRAFVHSATGARAAPWLATAGSGDVLAGLITGLLARGFDLETAAQSGCSLHVSCALRVGSGLIAEDIAEALPAVLATLTAAG